MECPKCQFENRERAKFCLKCGEKLELSCPQCGKGLPLLAEFCDQCGQRLEEVVKAKKTAPELEGERKHVTVLFSDLSGYTALSEKLDPEEVKEITSRIFSEISQVISKYEGFVEKFVGDAVMALFGVPKAHEDDPSRAIRAAREIHELVDALSPEIEKKIGQPISMHTGINTGLVVTGQVNLEKGTHGVAGDTINVAFRLSSVGKSGEILVGQDTYRQAEGYFKFEELEAARLKGKAESVQVYKVLSAKEKPLTTHRLSGLRSDLIGRKVEIVELIEAFERLQKGKGSIFSICGDAGTGKSRLIEEFKATLDLQDIQWLEGHAYAYSQNIPYFPLIDLLNRVFHIEEGDSTEKVRQKVESGLEGQVEKKESVVPYIGSLYSLSYPEIEEVSPEFWKSRLRDALQMILSALARRAPTIYFLEDLHWADPSFVELLRHVLIEVRQPAIVLCVYRPVFNLFTTQQSKNLAKVYHEIRLQDLSSSEAQSMLESLLKTDRIPSDLRRFVQDKAEGNPFYLEELVNSLIETETLIRDNGSWKITRTITETDISSTINGVISGRLDRLDKETKRALQEASVIGRAFLYKILKKVTELKQDIDRCLSGLEQLDLIRARSLQPDLEYIFKHALTQEVVYNGLLKKERKELHERVAHVIEQLFHDRLPEFYETLAFHFKQGQSIHKAVEYLMNSGEKTLGRYAVEESHQYYKEAFHILTDKADKSREEKELLIDLLIKWSLVFYYRGDSKSWNELLMAHKDLSESLDDKERLGMFYCWLGYSLWGREKFKDSYQFLHKALQIGEEIDNKRVIGYANMWLSAICSELGLLEQGIQFGVKGQKIAELLESDHYLYFKSLVSQGLNYFYMGENKKNFTIGKNLLDYGKRHSNIRCLLAGHIFVGNGYFNAGNFSPAIESYERAVEISADPFYAEWARLMLGMSYAQIGQFKEAEKAIEKVIAFGQICGCEHYRTRGCFFLGIAMIGKGHMSKGSKMLEEAHQLFLETESRPCILIYEFLVAKVYSQIALGGGAISLTTMAKNIGFLIKNVPFAGRRAEDHFNKAIEIAKEIGAKGFLGSACLDLGLLHKGKRRNDQARKCISEAIQIFEQCEAEIYLKQAKEALESIK